MRQLVFTESNRVMEYEHLNESRLVLRCDDQDTRAVRRCGSDQAMDKKRIVLRKYFSEGVNVANTNPGEPNEAALMIDREPHAWGVQVCPDENAGAEEGATGLYGLRRVPPQEEGPAGVLGEYPYPMSTDYLHQMNSLNISSYSPRVPPIHSHQYNEENLAQDHEMRAPADQERVNTLLFAPSNSPEVALQHTTDYYSQYSASHPQNGGHTHPQNGGHTHPPVEPADQYGASAHPHFHPQLVAYTLGSWEEQPLDLSKPKEEQSASVCNADLFPEGYGTNGVITDGSPKMEEEEEEEETEGNAWLKKIKTGTRSRVRSPKSWEFLLRLLMDRRSNPSMIKWESFKSGTFRLVQKDEIAKIWGMRSSKHKDGGLSYDNFARNLRYHYKTKMLVPVSEKHLVYRFSEEVMKSLTPPDLG